MSRSQRRRLLGLAAAGMSAGGMLMLRPSDLGRPLDAHFGRIAKALKAAGIAAPTLVIDRARLHANAAMVKQHLQHRLQLRLVNKSLPCMALLAEAEHLTGTHRQMVFNQPYLQLLAQHRPAADVLMGKPLPVAAAARFLAGPMDPAFDPSRQVQWLMDTPSRLSQYRDLARSLRRPMHINIEIDVGLHRGGVQDTATLQDMVTLLQSEPLLRWSGLMGYDGHTQKLPNVAGLRERSHQHALKTYRAFADHMRRSGLAPPAHGPTLNTGGSLTYLLHDEHGAANEVALGSALLKPSDFDMPLLSDLQPAAFIATPVLKVGPFQPPYGVESLGPLLRSWDRNQRQAIYIHGGNWLAHPHEPPGLQPSALIGTSSNQQLLLGSGQQALAPDDFVFLRPTQSEAILQQFGDIAVYEHGRITAMWPVFPAQV